MDYKDKVWLNKKYHTEHLSITDIAKLQNVSYTLIKSYMEKFEIPRRNRKEANMIHLKQLNKEWLTKEYVDNNRSSYSIADELKVDNNVIIKRLRLLNIPIRKSGSVHKLKISKEWLIEHYVNQKKSSYEIAKELNTVYRCVTSKLRQYNIRIRTTSENETLNIEQLNKEWLYKEYVINKRTLDSIATELKIGMSSVGRYLTSFGITKRNPCDYGKYITKPHKLMIELLEKYNIKHITSYSLVKFKEQDPQASPYEIDEYLPEMKVFLECHGTYWHSRINAKIRDKKKAELISKYYPEMKHFIIWEHDFKTDKAENTIKYIANLA